MTTTASLRQHPPEIRKVRAGWTRSSLLVLLVAAAALGTISSLARSATAHSAPDWWAMAWPLLLATGGFVTVACVSVFFWFVREIELSQREVVFRVGFRRIVVEWQNLVPPRAPYFITIVFRYRKNGVLQENGVLALTRRLAHAILLHPSCPKFEMAAKIWSSLRIRPPVVSP
jgi:hypothetical protein